MPRARPRGETWRPRGECCPPSNSSRHAVAGPRRRAGWYRPARLVARRTRSRVRVASLRWKRGRPHGARRSTTPHGVWCRRRGSPSGSRRRMATLVACTCPWLRKPCDGNHAGAARSTAPPAEPVSGTVESSRHTVERGSGPRDRRDLRRRRPGRGRPHHRWPRRPRGGRRRVCTNQVAGCMKMATTTDTEEPLTLVSPGQGLSMYAMRDSNPQPAD